MTSKQLCELTGLRQTQVVNLVKYGVFLEPYGPGKSHGWRPYRFFGPDIGIARIAKCLLMGLQLSTNDIRPIIRGISPEDLGTVAVAPENLYMIVTWNKDIPIVNFKRISDRSKNINIMLSRKFDSAMILNLDPRRNYHV